MAAPGFADVEAVTWVGVYAPAGTPQEIVRKLNSEIARIIREPDIKAKLDQQGFVSWRGPAGDLGKLISAEIKRWTGVAKANQDFRGAVGGVAPDRTVCAPSVSSPVPALACGRLWLLDGNAGTRCCSF